MVGRWLVLGEVDGWSQAAMDGRSLVVCRRRWMGTADGWSLVLGEVDGRLQVAMDGRDGWSLGGWCWARWMAGCRW